MIKSMLRPGFLKLAVISLLILGAAGRAVAQVPEALIMWPDIIYVNGEIVTMDDTRINDNPGTIVQAMAVRDEKIIALGTNEEIRRMQGPKTEVVDLQGLQVLPGLIDSHKHIMWGAEARATKLFNLTQTVVGYRLEIPVERTAKEILAKVEAAVNQLRSRVEVGPDEWIDVSLFPDTEKGYPSISSVSNLMDTFKPEDSEIVQADLDRIVSDRMFQVDSGGGIFSTTGDFEPGTWIKISAGPDGNPVLEPLFVVDEWEEWNYD